MTTETARVIALLTQFNDAWRQLEEDAELMQEVVKWAGREDNGMLAGAFEALASHVKEGCKNG